MIAGLSGDLVATAFLEHDVLPRADNRDADRLERHFHRWWRTVARVLGPASGVRAVADVAVTPLLVALGHETPAFVAAGDRMHAVSASSRCALVVVPWSESLAAAWRSSCEHAVDSGAHWMVLCNGRRLRIADATRTWSRAHLEFDFEPLFSTPKGIAALRLLASGTALSHNGPGSLHRYRTESDAHALRVCRSLSDAVLDHLPRLAEALAHRRGPAIGTRVALDQSLTIIYRILFLLFAEARDSSQCGTRSTAMRTASPRSSIVHSDRLVQACGHHCRPFRGWRTPVASRATCV